MTLKWAFAQSNKFLWIILCWTAVFSLAYAETTQINQTLRLGVLPDNEPQIIKQQYDPLLRYIKKQTGLTIELIIPKNYEDLLNLFIDKTIDLALFGGNTFIKAQQKAQAEALVMRDIDLEFNTAFLTQANNSKRNITDFKDAKFSFGAKLSTSGHIMPRYFLISQNITPETYFNEVRYSSSHDATVYSVRDGQVDLGAVNSKIVKNMLRDGRLKENEIRVLWKTPAYTNYVWATQPDFNETLRDRLLDSFLNLSLQNDAHREILTALNANSFFPANNEDFEALRQAEKFMAP